MSDGNFYRQKQPISGPIQIPKTKSSNSKTKYEYQLQKTMCQIADIQHL